MWIKYRRSSGGAESWTWRLLFYNYFISLWFLTIGILFSYAIWCLFVFSQFIMWKSRVPSTLITISDYSGSSSSCSWFSSMSSSSEMMELVLDWSYSMSFPASGCMAAVGCRFTWLSDLELCTSSTVIFDSSFSCTAGALLIGAVLEILVSSFFSSFLLLFI